MKFCRTKTINFYHIPSEDTHVFVSRLKPKRFVPNLKQCSKEANTNRREYEEAKTAQEVFPKLIALQVFFFAFNVWHQKDSPLIWHCGFNRDNEKFLIWMFLLLFDERLHNSSEWCLPLTETRTRRHMRRSTLPTGEEVLARSPLVGTWTHPGTAHLPEMVLYHYM